MCVKGDLCNQDTYQPGFMVSINCWRKKGFLRENVVMDTGDGMKVHVDDIHWDSGHTRMYTAGPVIVKSPEFELTGTGMHTENSFDIIDINSDIKVLVKSEGKGTFLRY